MLPALPTPNDGDCPAATAKPSFVPPLSPASAVGAPRGWASWTQRAGRLASWVLALPGRFGKLAALSSASATRRLLVPLLVVVLLLPGCSTTAQPPRRVVLEALALQIRLTQDQVAQALGLQPAGLPEVSRVRVEEQESIAIGEARGLRLTGRFDWRLAEDPIRVDSPFELYLQRGERGQSWRLARPLAGAENGEQTWITEPLPLPGERPLRPAPASASGSDGAG